MDTRQAYRLKTNYPMQLSSKTVNSLLCLLLLVVSGNPAIGLLNIPFVIVFVSAIFVIVAVSRRVRLVKSDVLIVSFFVLLFLLQAATHGIDVLPANLLLLLKMLIALLAIRVIPDFGWKLVEVMYALAIVSLIFFVPWWIGIDIASFAQPISIPFEQNGIQPSVHIGIHNYRIEVGDLIRNSGMFWEPGAFAGYLIFTMLFLVNSKRRDANKIFVVLSVALLSTQSTTGYLSYFVILIMYLWGRTAGMKILARYWLRLIAPLLAGIVAVGAYSNLDFLEEKISQQFMYGAEQSGELWEISRYGNALYDLKLIQEHPIVGLSMSNSTRGSEDLDVLMRQGNGFTGTATRLGVPALLLYIFLIFLRMKRRFQDVVLASAGTVVIVLLLQGEQFLFYPLFLVLMFASVHKTVEWPSSARINTGYRRGGDMNSQSSPAVSR